MITTLALIGVFFAYGLINYFLGRLAWHGIFKHLSHSNRWVFWLLFWLTSWAFVIVRIGNEFLPSSVQLVLSWLGGYWLAALYYLILILLVIGLLKVLDKRLRFLPSWFRFQPNKVNPLAVGVLVLMVAVLTYGTWNAHNPWVNSYQINIDKQSNLSPLHVVMVSDTHLGKIVDDDRLQVMVDMINELQPDIVLLAGDVVDSDISLFTEQRVTDVFKELQPPLGVFAVLGNHEHINGHVQETVENLEAANVQVLIDETVKIADSFYVVGRNDLSSTYTTGQPRKPLTELVKELDKGLPIILLDHQPYNLAEADQLGVDLQLSGHTHRGQIFPNHLITQRIFEVDWGYLAKDNLQVIVSNGFGTWGPPIRLGNRPEIVDIKITFKK
ncbi:metallophosphoesterase [Peptococcaceae bacterium 1198_IL3148]